MEVLMVFGKKETNIHAVLFKPFHETWHSEPVIRQAFTTTTFFLFYCTCENKSVFNIYSNYLQEMRESNIKRVAFFKYIYSVIELCHKFYLWC